MQIKSGGSQDDMLDAEGIKPMMSVRRRSRFAALAALAGMLFLQVALAFADCDLSSGADRPAMAAAMMQPAMADCHEADKDTHLCLAHCQGEERTIGKPQAALPDLSAAAMGWGVAWWQPAVRSGYRMTHGLSAAIGPPPRILYQSFLL